MRLLSSAASLVQHWWRGVARQVRSRGRFREDDREQADRQMMTLKLIREFYVAGQELKKFYIHNKVRYAVVLLSLAYPERCSDPAMRILRASCASYEVGR